MLSRVLEPEVMDTAEEATDYNQMDHSHVNRIFVDDFLSVWSPGRKPTDPLAQIFDAGTGTALIPIELQGRGVKARITASDLAESMLIVARQNVQAAGLESAVELVLRDCKKLPDPDGTYDAVISNSIVHHIPEPRDVLSEMWRVLKPGGTLFVRDLMRPDDQYLLDQIVRTYAGDANEHQQRMFRESLHAALTVNEVQQLLSELGLPPTVVTATSDRHWTIAATK